LCNEYAFLSRSLGFKATVTECVKASQNGTEGVYYKCIIRGDISIVPVKLNYKKAENSVKNPSISGFKIESIGSGDYYGFTLDGDHLYLLGDFTVTHNTTFMLTVACHNIRQGKDVLFVTHEGNYKYIRLMFLANMVGCSVDDILTLGITKDGRDRIAAAAAILEKHLTYEPYNKAKAMVVEEFIPTVIFANEQRKQEFGKGYDLFVDDYPFILNTELAFKGSLQRRNADAVVFNYFIQLGLEQGFHIIAAMQTNREGNKVNKKMNGENRILVQEDASEAFGPVMQASNIITLNRGPVAEQVGLMTFGLSKTRTNKKGGIAIIARTDYDRCMTHSNELGCMSYYGSKTIEDKYSSLEPKFKNQLIPLEALRGV
jgi:hypothetical protein